MSLVIVGSVAFDEIETPFGKSGRIVGGAGTYISLVASFFTKELSLISVVGNDFPTEFQEVFKEKQIDLTGFEKIPSQKSFFWKGKYHNDMNSRDTLVTELNVLENFKPQVPENFQNAEFVMLGNLTPAIQLSVIEQMKSTPKLIVLDTMNFWMDIALSELKEVIQKIDVLTINDEEARQLSGEYSLKKAAQIILTMGPKFLIIKKGEHGALLFDKTQMFYAPALPLEEVFDPTGAGDSFAGGFIGYLAATKNISFENMKRAVIYGSAMASFCVEKFGTENILDLNTPTVNDRVKEFIDLVDFNISH